MLKQAGLISILVVCIKSDLTPKKLTKSVIEAFTLAGDCNTASIDEFFKNYDAEPLKDKLLERCACKKLPPPYIFKNDKPTPIEVVEQTGKIEEIKFMWKIPKKFSETERKVIKTEMDSVTCMFMRLSPIILTETNRKSEAKIILQPKFDNKPTEFMSSGADNVLIIKNARCVTG